MVRILHPQEIQAFYILPAVRRAIALEFKKKGMAQNKIAELLGITPAAVTHYIQSKRAGELKLDKKTIQDVKKVARTAKTFHTLQAETQRLISTMWNEGHVCGMCHNVNKTSIACTQCFKPQENI